MKNVSKVIEGKNILTDINLEIKKGEVFALIGPNGAGKTTLVRLLLDLYRPTIGEIKVNVTNSNIGVLLDNLGLFKSKSAWNNIEFFYRIFKPKAKKEEMKKKINEIFNYIGLYEHRYENITFFSRGMKQRLAMGRALVNDPELVVLDEPLRGLDLEGQILVRDIILKLKDSGSTVFINSHNMDEIQRVADRIAFIKNGSIIKEGSVEDIMQEYNTDSLEVVYGKIIGF